MCIITDENDKVVSISLIPGLGEIPNSYHVYFPVVLNKVINIGDIYVSDKSKPEYLAV